MNTRVVYERCKRISALREHVDGERI